jgi:hypothetical protein
MPVNAITNCDLPWSICPAVPITYISIPYALKKIVWIILTGQAANARNEI